MTGVEEDPGTPLLVEGDEHGAETPSVFVFPSVDKRRKRDGGRRRRAQAQAVYCRLPTDAPLTTNSTRRSNSADVGGGGEGGEDGGAAAYEFPNKRLLKPVRRRSSLFPAVVAPASM